MRKLLKCLSVLLLISLGVCFFKNDIKDVSAASGDVTEGDGYVAVEYTDLNAYRTSEGNIAPTYGTDGKWIFAGWYKDAKCETIFANLTAESTLAYAKFVPANILSVKLQLKEGATTSNMRIVSSVDSLDYKNVGFQIQFEGFDEPKTVETGTVYKRIVASAESGVDYNYSSKVIDVESEYFVTATIVNVASGNYNKSFFIKPYWTTADGTVVYGVNRYVTINNGLSTTNINVPVKVSKALAADTLSVSVAGTSTYEASVAYYDGIYAHLNITVPNRDSVLKSVSAITVSDGTTSGSTIYRNLETTHVISGSTSINADTSWYDANADKMVLVTSADFYGFASQVNSGTNFNSKKVYLVADVAVNKGKAGETSWDTTTDAEGNSISDGSGTNYTWPQIGNAVAKKFDGTFDGQMHTISGVVGNKGLFGITGANSTVKNFRLENSYFATTSNGSGSVVGYTYGGSVENVYSGAYINTVKFHTGGIVGSQDSGKLYITNCWFAGTINTTMAANGGIMGKVTGGTANISDCLFTGNIKISSSVTAGNKETGGIVGTNASVLNLSNSLNSGLIVYEGSNTITGVNRLVGNNTKATLTITDSCYTNEGFNGSEDYYSSVTVTGEIDFQEVKRADILDKYAYFNTKLFKNSDMWALIEGETPILKLFASDALENPVVPANADIDWLVDYVKATPNSFTICDNQDNNDANVKELYGFAYLVEQGITFDGKTVKLAADVVLNDVDATTEAEWTTYLATSTPKNSWTPIGTRTSEFAGTFDGGMHSIKGVYINTTTDSGVGFFKSTAAGSTIKNLKIKNSYINSTQQLTGSVVGSCSGNLENIYSNAVVKSSNYITGGIVGTIWNASNTVAGAVQVAKCWFDGELNTQKNTNGGVIGLISYGYVEMSDCLYTGKITFKDGFTGGLVARTFNYTDKWCGTAGTTTNVISLTITNSLNMGTIGGTAGKGFVGSTIGRIQRCSLFTVEALYATTESDTYNTTSTWIGTGSTTDSSAATVYAEADITVSDMTDETVIQAAKDKLAGFDFESVWTIGAEGTPKLIMTAE